jgi:hypothetical protein
MLNSDLNEFASVTALTQTTSWFDAVDNAAKAADTNKRYYMSSNPATSPNVPIKEGSFTTITISAQSDNITDLYNSFLTAEIKLTLGITNNATFKSVLGTLTNPDAAAGLLPTQRRAVWVGYKDSMDSIAQYQLFVDGNLTHSQTNAIEESYITGCACTEEVKRADVFSKTRHEDVWNRINTKRTGALFEFDLNGDPYNELDVLVVGGTTITRTIPVKIDFRRFLPLASIRFLPAFMKSVQLKIQFSPEALVYCPISPQSVLGSNFNINTCPMITNRFMPLGTNIKMLNTVNNALTTVDFSMSKRNRGEFEVTSCDSHLWCFGLDEELYEVLVQRYSGVALSFPVQQIVWTDMTGSMNAYPTGTVNAGVQPRFVDSIFLLFRKSYEYKTVYENPRFEQFILKMGAFGTIPQTPIRSDGPILFELTQNALNLNNDITGINQDVMKSLITLVDPTKPEYSVGLSSNDITNFFIALPTSLDNTFQQGQTGNSPVTYSLQYTYEEKSPFSGLTNSQCLIGFLKDSVLSVQINPSGKPIAELNDYVITAPSEMT